MEEVAPIEEQKISDKELNFNRLREKTKRMEQEAEKLRKEKEEIAAAAQRDREELAALRAKQQEMQLEASLFSEEEEENPEDLVSVAKLKAKQKKGAAQQAHVLHKQAELLQKQFERKLEEAKTEMQKTFQETLTKEEALNLYETYGESAIQAEVEGNKHLAKALSLMGDAERVRYLNEHFREKERAKKLLEGDNRGSHGIVNTGIGSGLVDRGDAIPETVRSIQGNDIFDEKKAKGFNDSVYAHFFPNKKAKG